MADERRYEGESAGTALEMMDEACDWAGGRSRKLGIRRAAVRAN